MSGWIVVERPTGPVEDKVDNVFGPFQAPVVAELWIEKRKEIVKAHAKLTNTEVFERRHPRMYFVAPLFEPNW